MPKSTLDKILAIHPDPLDVLKTTAHVVKHARFVKINLEVIERTADILAEKNIEPPAWNSEHHFFDGTERTVTYLCLLDALNFCFWGKPKWGITYNGKKLDGYWALAAALKRAMEKHPHLADAEFLARIPPQELALTLRGNTTIPLFAERWRNVRELGAVLRGHWGGSAAAFVADAQRDAPCLAQMLAENLASFNDVTVYENREVRFFKRAQILVCDLRGAFGGKAWGAFDNIATLTAFADYKLPQILRAWRILNYAPALARKVDARKELAAGSAAETEIRATTLWAVEFLRDALTRRGCKLWSVQLDWILWEASQGQFAGMKPYHRVRTIYY
jgi:hypothetical protein